MKKTLLGLTFLAFSALTHSEQLTVEYYGVVSNSSDVNMMKVAQDIFLTQLKSIDYLSVEDKRLDASQPLKNTPVFQSTENPHIVFYAEISEVQQTEGAQKTWNCKFNAMNPEDQILHTKDENYESHYKMLSSAKSVIEEIVLDFRTEDEGSVALRKSNKESEKSTFQGNIDIESLSGTWYGEPYTDKIIILRGGRGFIIFKNGATMNIKIAAKKFDNKGNATEIEVSQIGKSNASYFPELPRQTALNVAATAPVIKWTFSVNSNELTGKKKTLISEADGLSAKEGVIDCKWTKTK